MMTRQMLSMVSSGRMPRWRSTRRRIMSASRAGRNAEPTSCVCFTRIKRSMMSPRCISRRCTPSSMESISLRNSASEGGEGGLDMLGNLKKISLLIPRKRGRRMRFILASWFEMAQVCAPPRHGVLPCVNHAIGLTQCPLRTSFVMFRGHLSRPACSHVKQLAKQAGDRMIPAEPLFRPVFYWPEFCSGSGGLAKARSRHMVSVKSITSPAIHEERSHEVDHPNSLLARFGTDQPLKLDCGLDLAPFQIAYQTYGTLNADRSNAVLICHALTLDQHVANTHPLTGKSGWWDVMVGPGLPLDTNRYFIICANVIGGCMGSTGPASTNPATGKPWGLDFPVVTIPDMVRAQAMLLDKLGIKMLFCVVGGSMGGMQVLQWTAAYPERVFSALPIACATRHSAQNIAFHELGRQ